MKFCAPSWRIETFPAPASGCRGFTTFTSTFTARMQDPEPFYDTLYRVGADEDGPPLSPGIVAQLVAFGMVEIVDGVPQLTEYGDKCFVVIESGDGIVTEFQ